MLESDKTGLIIGVNEDNSLIYTEANDYRHVLLLAPTGMGKGMSFVIPNLLSWNESAIVHDIKLENYAITSGWRAKQGQKIYLFNPLDKNTHCYNPLDFISQDPEYIVNDIQKIASIFIVENGALHSAARNLFVALVMSTLADSAKSTTFGKIFRIVSQKDLSIHLNDSLNNQKLHTSCSGLIQSFLNQNEKFKNKIIALLLSCLELWSNPLIDYATSKTDFNFADFKKTKSTLYVGLQPLDISRLQSLMQLFYQHMFLQLCNNELNNDDDNGVLCILDEFTTIGKMELLVSSMPYSRGYKLKLLLIAEDLNSINSVYGAQYALYGNASTILNNAHTKICFTATNMETGFYISHISVDTDKKEALISWQEVMCLPKEKQIIIELCKKPEVARKLYYYSNPQFEGKVITPVVLFS